MVAFLPDKNPDNPNAAAEFAALQRAYDVLTDTEAKAALDALLRCVMCDSLLLLLFFSHPTIALNSRSYRH